MYDDRAFQTQPGHAMQQPIACDPDRRAPRCPKTWAYASRHAFPSVALRTCSTRAGCTRYAFVHVVYQRDAHPVARRRAMVARASDLLDGRERGFNSLFTLLDVLRMQSGKALPFFPPLLELMVDRFARAERRMALSSRY